MLVRSFFSRKHADFWVTSTSSIHTRGDNLPLSLFHPSFLFIIALLAFLFHHRSWWLKRKEKDFSSDSETCARKFARRGVCMCVCTYMFICAWVNEGVFFPSSRVWTQMHDAKMIRIFTVSFFTLTSSMRSSFSYWQQSDDKKCDTNSIKETLEINPWHHLHHRSPVFRWDLRWNKNSWIKINDNLRVRSSHEANRANFLNAIRRREKKKKK